MKSPARLLIAEDHAVLRDGLTAVLALKKREFEVVGEVDNGLDAIRQAKALKPDLVLLDIRMPHSNGTDVLEEIKKRVPATKVLVLTHYQTEDYVLAAIAAGAEGYFVKTDGMTELLSAMRSILSGDTYLSPRICHYVVEGYRASLPKPADPLSRETLTARERTLIKLIAEGHKNHEIAATLSLSRRTIEKYRSGIMKKLKLQSTSALIAYAMEHKLI